MLLAINSNLGKCKEINVNKKYTFKQNKTFEEIKTALPEGYSIIHQVIGFDYTIIGLIIKKEYEFFIPCKPSNMNSTINVIRIHSVVWNTYDDTVKALIELYKASNKDIFCLPRIRVIQDTMIVGILTMTNQFIEIKEPEYDEYDEKDRYGLDKIEDHNYIHDDMTIVQNPASDYKDKMIHRLKLERKFYSA